MSNQIKSFDACCPWCSAINQRQTLYWVGECFFCNMMFYVNKNKKTCRVKRGILRWEYLDELKPLECY